MKRIVICLSLILLTACPRPQITREIGRRASPSPSPVASPIASPTPASLRFAVIGDWGAATVQQAEVASAMCREAAEEPFDFVLTTGDNFYPRGQATKQNYHDPESCLIGMPGHVWHAAWGNHDALGTSTADVLGARRYYSFSTDAAEFFVLDSNKPADKEQLNWLEQGLAAQTLHPKIVVFHHPPFTTGSVHESNAAVRSLWVPLFERYGVILVLNGHNHIYEHSQVNGIDYVVTGGGGASLYRCARQETWLQKCTASHHFLVITVEERTTAVVSRSPAGDLIDSFVIQEE